MTQHEILTNALSAMGVEFETVTTSVDDFNKTLFSPMDSGSTKEKSCVEIKLCHQFYEDGVSIPSFMFSEDGTLKQWGAYSSNGKLPMKLFFRGHTGPIGFGPSKQEG